MLDTCTLNAVTDGDCDLSLLGQAAFYITHVQRDELNRTVSPERLESLLTTLTGIAPETTATHTAIWDDSRWDESNWSDGGRYERMLSALKQLNKRSKKTPRDRLNESRDVRIGETAIEECMVLVTSDRNLATVVQDFGGSTILPPKA